MRLTHVLAGLVAASVLTAGAVMAQGADPLAAAVKARQSHMQLYAFNLGLLGGMAQGNIAYDSAAASAAAANLAALSALDQSRYWPMGSAAGEVEGSRALAAIWAEGSDAAAKGQALNAAAVAMAAVAGTDLASLQGAMGALGGACGACHQSYRQTN
ncbi:MAG: cytochrome c [Rhodobacterales bacterium]|nr:cytochrome c [Rhodobacterales bacterium]NCT12451.1 cytochrome c [Rhodobacterales bacterium]